MSEIVSEPTDSARIVSPDCGNWLRNLTIDRTKSEKHYQVLQLGEKSNRSGYQLFCGYDYQSGYDPVENHDKLLRSVYYHWFLEK